MINIYRFIYYILNNKSSLFYDIKNNILNKSIYNYYFKFEKKYDVDYFIYQMNDIKFNYNLLHYYNINHSIYLYKISFCYEQILILKYYNNLLLLKNKIYELCFKHNHNKYYNIIDNITSHIIYNIQNEHIEIYDKYDYIKNGIYYKIKNKICYYYYILNYIIKYNKQLMINKFINKYNDYIIKDLYYIDKYENDNIYKILIK